MTTEANVPATRPSAGRCKGPQGWATGRGGVIIRVKQSQFARTAGVLKRPIMRNKPNVKRPI